MMRAEKLAIRREAEEGRQGFQKNSYREVQRYDHTPRMGNDRLEEEKTNVPLYDKGGKKTLKWERRYNDAARAMSPKDE